MSTSDEYRRENSQKYANGIVNAKITTPEMFVAYTSGFLARDDSMMDYNMVVKALDDRSGDNDLSTMFRYNKIISGSGIKKHFD